ncbi:hypothetical protein [Paenibacillus sp. GM2]|uniref:hypothetical protein n=2 Tax=unclassified Paenibacillus TaxID=185978 RepID=UPI001E3070F2|nr:hypothetical protein [Paenibacillus sp. GM2]
MLAMVLAIMALCSMGPIIILKDLIVCMVRLETSLFFHHHNPSGGPVIIWQEEDGYKRIVKHMTGNVCGERHVGV